MDLDGIFIEHHGPSEGPAIVLVHGAPDRSTSFSALLSHLGDHRVVTYDRRGYGRSLGATPPATMADHADDLVAILETLDAPPRSSPTASGRTRSCSRRRSGPTPSPRSGCGRHR